MNLPDGNTAIGSTTLFITGAADSFRTLSERLEAAVPDLKKLPLDQALEQWYELREAHEALDTQRKRISAVIEELSRKTLPEMMEENNCKTFTHKGIGRRFTVAQRTSCSMVDKGAGIEWLKENGHGGIVIETVNSSTLAAFATKLLADTGTELPEYFKMNSMNYTSATKI